MSVVTVRQQQKGHNNQRQAFNNNNSSHHKEFQCRDIFNNIRYVSSSNEFENRWGALSVKVHSAHLSLMTSIMKSDKTTVIPQTSWITGLSACFLGFKQSQRLRKCFTWWDSAEYQTDTSWVQCRWWLQGRSILRATIQFISVLSASEFTRLCFCTQMNQVLRVGCLKPWHRIQPHGVSQHGGRVGGVRNHVTEYRHWLVMSSPAF